MNKNMIEINDNTNKGEIKMKKMKRILKNEKGLTLIELLAVIVILAIVAAIAVPSIGNIVNNSRDKAILADASNILAGAKIAHVEGACKTAQDTTSDECTKSELAGYIEGLSDDSTYTVNKTTTGWDVTYNKFEKIVGAKYKEEITSNKISEANLNANLKK